MPAIKPTPVAACRPPATYQSPSASRREEDDDDDEDEQEQEQEQQVTRGECVLHHPGLRLNSRPAVSTPRPKVVEYVGLRLPHHKKPTQRNPLDSSRATAANLATSSRQPSAAGPSMTRKREKHEFAERSPTPPRQSKSRVVWVLDVTRFPRDQNGDHIQLGSRYYIGTVPHVHTNRAIVQVPSKRKFEKMRADRVPPSIASAPKARSVSRPVAPTPPAAAPPKPKICLSSACNNPLTPGVRSMSCAECRRVVARYKTKLTQETSPERGRSPGPAADSYVDMVVPIRDPSESRTLNVKKGRSRSRSVSVPRATRARRTSTPAPMRRRSGSRVPPSPDAPQAQAEIEVERDDQIVTGEGEWEQGLSNGLQDAVNEQEPEEEHEEVVPPSRGPFDFASPTPTEPENSRPGSKPPPSQLKKGLPSPPPEPGPSTSASNSRSPLTSPTALSLSAVVARTNSTDTHSSTSSRPKAAHSNTASTRKTPFTPNRPPPSKGKTPQKPAAALYGSPPRFSSLADALNHSQLAYSAAARAAETTPSEDEHPVAGPSTNNKTIRALNGKPPVSKTVSKSQAAPEPRSAPKPRPKPTPKPKISAAPARVTAELEMEGEGEEEEDPKAAHEYVRSFHMWDALRYEVNGWRKNAGAADDGAKGNFKGGKARNSHRAKGGRTSKEVEKYFHGYYKALIDPAVVSSFPVSQDAINTITTEIRTNGKFDFDYENPLSDEVSGEVRVVMFRCLCAAGVQPGGDAPVGCEGTVTITVEPTTGNYAIKLMRVTVLIKHETS
ncbi:hypothetical protein BXZ70DRAFT_916879 [Cristinia sonorae]|uniref:Uncharacterized protein n=1 Tax=Cristinia sonorae TaxID=1940300 RepID=A0A8K0UXP1_9AGAR|nr:hypothetical protein BXZ70DRAFT_916879 [Cristinia sonorae]